MLMYCVSQDLYDRISSNKSIKQFCNARIPGKDLYHVTTEALNDDNLQS